MNEILEADALVKTLRGRKNLSVSDRVRLLKQCTQTCGIETQLIELNGDLAVVKAAVIFDGNPLAEAHGSAEAHEYADYVEMADNAAIGRALALSGISPEYAPELDRGRKRATARRRERAAGTTDGGGAPGSAGRDADPATPAPSSFRAQIYRCQRCGREITGCRLGTGETLSAADMAARSLREFDRVYCLSCARLEKEDRARFGGEHDDGT